MKGPLGKLLSPFGLTQLVMLATIGTALWLCYEPWRWGRIRDEIRERSPQVDHIDGAALEAWITAVKAGTSADPAVIVDVRSASAFAHSHLPSAVHTPGVPTPAQLGLIVEGDNAEQAKARLLRPIVVCCEVGHQSAEIATMLKARGLPRVQMLDGGVFQWANERRPLVDQAGNAAKTVHPGTSPHAGLLRRAATAP